MMTNNTNTNTIDASSWNQQQQQQQAIFINHTNNNHHHVILSSPPPNPPLAHEIRKSTFLLLAVVKSTFSAQSDFDTIAFYAAMFALFLIFFKDHVVIATTPRSRARIFAVDVAIMILEMVSITSFLMAHLQRVAPILNQQLRIISAKAIWMIIVFCLTVGIIILCVVLPIRRRLQSTAARRPPV